MSAAKFGNPTFVDCCFSTRPGRFTTCPLCGHIVWHDEDDDIRLGFHDAKNSLPCPNGGESVEVLYEYERSLPTWGTTNDV